MSTSLSTSGSPNMSLASQRLNYHDQLALIFADSALHAPSAGLDDEDFYPDLFDKAAVLCWRLARNHPLPDGNKRASWTTMTLFIDLNDGRWDPDPPDVDDAATTMIAVAAGEIDEATLASWLRERVTFDSSD